MVDSPAHFGRTVWALTYAPVVWATHLLVCYCTAAVFCAKAPASGAALDPVRTVVAVATAIALAAIAYVGVQAWRRWRAEDDIRPDPTPNGLGRNRFLAYATFLLAGLSAIGTVYVALPALFITACDG